MPTPRPRAGAPAAAITLRAAGVRSRFALFLASGAVPVFAVPVVAVSVVAAPMLAVVVCVGRRRGGGWRRRGHGRGRRLSGRRVVLVVRLPVLGRGCSRGGSGRQLVLAMPPDRLAVRRGGRRHRRRGRSRRSRSGSRSCRLNRRGALRPGRLMRPVNPMRLLDGARLRLHRSRRRRRRYERRWSDYRHRDRRARRGRRLRRMGMARFGHGDDLPRNASDHREQRSRGNPGPGKEERGEPDRPGRCNDDQCGSGDVGVGRLHLGVRRSRSALGERSTVHKMYRARGCFSRPDNGRSLPQMGQISSHAPIEPPRRIHNGSAATARCFSRSGADWACAASSRSGRRASARAADLLGRPGPRLPSSQAGTALPA